MTEENFKLTSNSGEEQLGVVLGNASIFSIPFFQRPYRWDNEKIKTFNEDLLSVVDQSTDAHFLGAIIIHGLYSDPGRPRIYEVIDGQQRLTTLYLYVAAIIKTLIECNEKEEAALLFRSYIVSGVTVPNLSNLTLHPCKEDQGDLNAVVRELLETRDFGTTLEGFKFQPLPETSEAKGRISVNFRAAKKFLRSQYEKGKAERISEITRSLLNRFSVVSIQVKDPTNGPKIFNSLNSKQQPMTIGDLVRNEVFSRKAAIDPTAAALIDLHEWQPFYERFKVGAKNHFDSYFFPFGLIHDSNLRKSEVHSFLSRKWRKLEPTQIIKQLLEYQDSFLDFIQGTNKCGHAPETALRFHRLYELGAPGSLLPFVMRISNALRDGELDQQKGREILDVLDSFLTRRALCGYEPTGLHAVFKRLWLDAQESEAGLCANGVSSALASHKTVAWPSDLEVRASILNRGIYKTSIDDYLILEYDRAQGGDHAENVPWIEHVLPTTYSEDWAAFSVHDHAKMKDLFANLIPLTSAMNAGLGNRAYEVKRPIYQGKSAFISARQFADTYEEWTPEKLRERGELLADWFVKRWSAVAPVNQDQTDSQVAP